MSSVFEFSGISDLLDIGFFPHAKSENYIKRRARELLRDNPELAKILSQPHEIIHPDNPDVWFQAGYYRIKNAIICRAYRFSDYSTYANPEGYKATNFAHTVHAVFVPTMELPEYLEQQVEIDETDGAFYSEITLREGDRDDYSSRYIFETAEELLLWLSAGGSSQRGRDSGSYPYIQVCYIL